MNPNDLALTLQSKGASPAIFADAALRAREVHDEGEREFANLTSNTLGGIALGAIAVGGSAAIGSFMAPVWFAALGGLIAYSWGDHVTKIKPKMEAAKELENLLTDATSDQWAELAANCGCPDDLMDCLRAGMLAGRKAWCKPGARYQAALAHAHGLGKVLPEGFKAPERTALNPVKPRSWRDEQPEDAIESDPTEAEVKLIIRLCNERVGVKPYRAKILELRDEGRIQAAVNLAIVNAGITDRDYVKNGLELRRLRAIKAWAAKGDPIALPATAPTVIEETPVVEVVEEPIVQPTAAKPSFISIAATVAPPAPVPIVEETQVSDDEGFDDETEYIEEALPAIASPTFQRTPKLEISIWDSTDLETIEPVDIGNVNKFPIVLVVAGQGNGKTVTLAYLFECLTGRKALYTPKTDDHRNPAIQKIFDLRFGFNPVTNRGAWFGNQDSFDNSPQMDLDWYLHSASNKSGSALDFLHAANQTAVNRTAGGTKKGRDTWRVFYDEAAQTYSAGFVSTIGPDGTSMGRKGEQECQWFISSKLKPAIFNWRGAGVQLFIGCQSETVENIGLKGCAEARDEAWHLYPGPKAIEVAKKHKQSKLASFLQRALSDGYAIALLEKEGQQFKVIRMPKLSALERFDPVIEGDDEPIAQPQQLSFIVENEDPWEDDIVEDADAESIELESIDDIAQRIMAMDAIPLTTRLAMIETEIKKRG